MVACAPGRSLSGPDAGVRVGVLSGGRAGGVVRVLRS